ncbi:hypothetical protein GCM10010174_70340 [Kutzneria viridogrisea]|uniref:Transcriptional regulator with XRE-family HTH domain n=1 Tax=Kutzneria viridogrisea TaxID=47990 RepID=A0ABR6BAS7_9PSEU|nr:transcriptional regulator with XRE-family HTH domain [Kutzneria viridogrisea]
MNDFESERLAFGDELLRLREAAGLTGASMAERLGWTASKVSKIERGRQTATDSDVVEWCAALGLRKSVADALRERGRKLRIKQVAWRRQLRHGHQSRQQQSGSSWATASTIRGVSTMAVPGILQTPVYARAVFETQAELLKIPATDVPASVNKRIERQRHLYDGDKVIEILVTEAALTNPVCEARDMVAQLDRLVAAVDLPTIQFGVIPLYRKLPRLVPHGFWIFDAMVRVETVSAELEVVDSEQVAVYAELADELWTVAVEGAEARAILLACGRHWAELAD